MLVPATTNITTGEAGTRQNSTGTRIPAAKTMAKPWPPAVSMPPMGPSTAASTMSSAPSATSCRRLVRSTPETAVAGVRTTSVAETEGEDERQREAGHHEDRDVRRSAVRPVAEAEKHGYPHQHRHPLHPLTARSSAATSAAGSCVCRSAGHAERRAGLLWPL